jgi:hypothetical protein
VKGRKRNPFKYDVMGDKGEAMTFKITIKEVHEAVVEIDTENYYEALAKVESDYWKNPNDYLLEPKDTTFE